MLKVEFVLCSRHSYCAQLAVADARQPSVRASAAFFSTLNFHKIITLHTVTSDMALNSGGSPNPYVKLTLPDYHHICWQTIIY